MGNNPIVHILTVYDGESEDLSHFIELPKFDIAVFREQFAVDPEGDPGMLDKYSVGPDDTKVVLAAADEGGEISFDFTRWAYFIEAVEKDEELAN